MAIESANEAEAERVEIPLEDILTGLEQSILLVGQSFNAVTYQRRCNVLSVLMKDHKSRQSCSKFQKVRSYLVENSGNMLWKRPR